MFMFMSSPIPHVYVYVYVSMCLNLKNPAGANILETLRMVGKTSQFKEEVQAFVANEKKAWMAEARRALQVTY